MPFALLGLHRYLRDPRPRWLALFAGGWFLQGICNGYYLLFFSVFVGLWILWFASPWTRPREFLAIERGVGRRGRADAAAAAALSRDSRVVRLRARLRDDPRFRRRRGRAAVCDRSPGACGDGSRCSRRAEGELFPGLTITLLVAGRRVVRARSASPERYSWVLVRRVLIVLALGTALVSLSAVVMGSWRLEPFGVRLLSVSNPIKPLTFSLRARARPRADEPRASARVRRALGPRRSTRVAGFIMWLFSLGPTPTLMGNQLMYRGTLCAADVSAGIQLAARAGAILDGDDAVPGRRRGDRVRSPGVEVWAQRAWRGRRRLDRRHRRHLDVGDAAGGRRRSRSRRWDALRKRQDRSWSCRWDITYPDVAAMYRQMSHGRPVVNGYSGYFPPHYAALRVGFTLRDPGIKGTASAITTCAEP